MLQRSAEGGMKVKRRNFFSTLLGGALGLVGMKGARAEERVTDRLRRRLEEVSPFDNHALHIREHDEMLRVTHGYVPAFDLEMPEPLYLPEMPPEIFEAQQKWKKEHGL